MSTFSLDYIDDLYVKFVNDPSSVPDSWRHYFKSYLTGSETQADRQRMAQMLTAAAGQNGTAGEGGATGDSGSAELFFATAAETGLSSVQDRINQLVREYRVRGHLIAQLDPLGMVRPEAPSLEPQSYGIGQQHLETPISDQIADSSSLGHMDGSRLQDVLQKLQNTYCRSIGVQFMHIDSKSAREWLQERMEPSENHLQLSFEAQKRIYARLADATIFEEFVRRKYIGAKTFSLEGAESLIPMLDLALDKAGEHGVKEVVMGMAHRGRLNVLANILKKRAKNIFWSFKDPDPEKNRGRGDVRYHLGYSNDWHTSTGKTLHISMCFNPSHLEFVNTVALGRCRSKQDRRGDTERTEVMPILIHGDAAFAGEGIVQETLNLSQLSGYACGGALHIIINNQIGFTTEPSEGRSTIYATDVAKMLQSPIFHVNGEDPEAVAQAVSVAMDFRHAFKRDVVIDLWAYRRWGHNEADEPRYTQPEMYAKIDAQATVRENYLGRLLKLGQMSPEEAERIQNKRLEKLENEFAASESTEFVQDEQTLGGVWKDYEGGSEPESDDTSTGVDKETLVRVIDGLTRLPEGFAIHGKLRRPMITFRREMAEGSRPLDWATAEAAAFGTLADAGYRVRLTGQDCERGTFSQRHANLHNTRDGGAYMPLQHLSPNQAPVEIVNSPLSEAGVLGFEYGYSLDRPDGLVAWEAQFGDFWNVAQVIVDQFIASAEDKWKRLSGLVMLLPHGFEGQGPEHCSARVERFLLMTAEYNIQVVQPTTPAQYFHLLRRQVLRSWRKPLVVLTPKSLLRHKLVHSSLEDLYAGAFHKILADHQVKNADAKRMLLCSGKVYFDLLEEREKRGLKDVAIQRVEQLYPLSEKELMQSLAGLPESSELIWVQEEPRNMGAWPYFFNTFGLALLKKYGIDCLSREASASPSTGSLQAHKMEQAELIEKAFAGFGDG